MSRIGWKWSTSVATALCAFGAIASCGTVAETDDGDTGVPQSELASDYIPAPGDWTAAILPQGLLASVDGEAFAIQRLARDNGSDLASARLEIGKRSAIPVGKPFGIDGRELYPRALVPISERSRLVAIACKAGSELDECEDASIEMFDLAGEAWTPVGRVALGDFVLSRWVVLSAAAASETEVAIAVTNVDPGPNVSRSATVLVRDDGSTAQVSSSDVSVDATCPATPGVLQLERGAKSDQPTIRPAFGAQDPPPVRVGAGNWSLSCAPSVLWASTGVWNVGSGSPVDLSWGQPVAVTDGVVVTADSAGTEIQLATVAEPLRVAARYKLDRPFGPVSTYATPEGELAAMDVAPPDDEHLSVWTRTPRAAIQGPDKPKE